jgi:hypothetical protein
MSNIWIIIIIIGAMWVVSIGGWLLLNWLCDRYDV